ncbi:MAG: hypothetical protein RLZZ437_2686, partial [Pseudomonadota bacterium]
MTEDHKPIQEKAGALAGLRVL